LTLVPEAGAQCGSPARWDLCGGPPPKGGPHRDCVFSTVEPCRSFDVRGNRAAKRLEVVRRSRKCLHYYYYYYYCYFIHPELGFIHVRLQS